MRVWREASRLAMAARRATVLPAPTSPGDHAEGVLADAPADPGGGLGVGGVAVQHARRQVTAERHFGEAVVGLEFLDAHSSSWAFPGSASPGFPESASSMVSWPGS